MSSEVIKKTQEMLGKYVSKPPLTDKLLGKPPFRYLHDILNVVINDHGFLKGLYDENELKSEHVKDKEAKIAFLQKWIDATSLAVGETLNVKASKIVAGQEIENTNLLLQATAKGIEKKIDSTKAVGQVLSQPKTSRKEAKERPKDKTKEKTDSKKERPSNKERTSTRSKVPIADPSRKSKKESRAPGKATKASKDPTNKATRGSRDPSKATPGVVAPPVVSRKKASTSVKDSKSADKKEAGKSKSRTTKSDKDGRERAGKEEKPKTRTKPPEPGRSKKPVSEAGKENSPPTSLPPAPDDVNDVSGTMASEETPEGQEDGPIKSEALNGDDGDPMEAIENGVINEEDEPKSDELAQGLGSDDPTSLLTFEGDTSGEANALSKKGDQPVFPPSEGDDLFDNPDNGPPPDEVQIRNHLQHDVDPAILKAMGRNEDPIMGGEHFNGLGPTDPSDSGVGSLESPKNTAKVESLPNAAEPKEITPVPIPPTPGPRPAPLKAYHPDLSEADMGLPDGMSNSQQEDLPERPKTGMGIRPRTGRKSARPPSARPAPPKVRERREIPPEEMPRPPTGKPLTNVILDSDTKGEEDGIDDDDDTFTVGNTESILDDETIMERAVDPNVENQKQELLEGDQDAKGILVAQILETKKELEDNRREAFSPETPGHRRVPLEQAFQGDASRRKEKELIQKDVEKLTSSIQALTRSVNPLAKMLDYLQEDFDSMQKELESWRKENKILEQNLKSEQSLTEHQLEPLKKQLEEMDAAIFDQRDRISAIKSIILRNEEKSGRLLAGININS